MFIVRNKAIIRNRDPPYMIVINLSICEGLVIFPTKNTFSVCALINGNNEQLAVYASREEAEAMVDEIIKAIREGATVYDCTKRR